MTETLKELCKKLEEIGPSRRKGDILVEKYNEAKEISKKYANYSYLDLIKNLEESGKLSV